MELFDKIPDLIQEKGIALAEAQSQFEFLEEDKKVYLATLMNQCEGSEASRERQARVKPEWSLYLEGVREARETMLRLKAEYVALQSSFDYMRSMNANSRNNLR